MKRSFVLPLALLFVLLVAVPVSAAPPVIEEGEFELNEVFSSSLCPGFEVWDHEVGTFRQMSYFDNQGNLKRIKIILQGTDNFYNPANPDVILSGSFAGTTDIDLETGEFVFTNGLPVHITAPGYGTVLVRAGRWLRYPNIHFAGKDSFEDPEDIAQFCALLATE